MTLKEQRNSNRKNSFCEGAKKLQQKFSFCKGAEKLQYTNFELNKILIQSEARERVKDTLPHKIQNFICYYAA